MGYAIPLPITVAFHNPGGREPSEPIEVFGKDRFRATLDRVPAVTYFIASNASEFF
jgi:hypothetical protein